MLKHAPDPPVLDVSNMASQYNMPKAIAKVMVLRGHTVQSAYEFIDPGYVPAHDPYALLNMDRAMQRMQLAYQRQERILVWGDNDMDGDSATTLMVSVLQAVGFQNVRFFVPERREGYGAKVVTLDEQYRYQPFDMMITVDSGIKDHDPIAHLLNTYGVDTIVTDHHTAGDTVPQAIVIDPNQPGDTSGQLFNELAGVGIAYLFADALVRMLMPQANAADHLLDLVALGTMGDQMNRSNPLNRAFIRYGMNQMKAMSKPRHAALAVLLKNSSLSVSNLDFYAIPSFNSASRLNVCGVALSALMEDSVEAAKAHAKHLLDLNEKRKCMVEDAMYAAHIPDKGSNNILWVTLDSEVDGAITGLVANKIAQREDMVTCVYTAKDDGEYFSGSLRVPRTINVNLVEALNQFNNVSGGGHAGAVGFGRVLSQHWDSFRQHMENAIRAGASRREINIDGTLTFAEINNHFYNWLERLQPFGQGNPKPVFYSEEVTVTKSRLFGRGDAHMNVTFQQGQYPLDATIFSVTPEQRKLLVSGAIVNVAYTIEWSDFNNTIELHPVDINEA